MARSAGRCSVSQMPNKSCTMVYMLGKTVWREILAMQFTVVDQDEAKMSKAELSMKLNKMKI